MLSKSLIQISVDERGCVPSVLFDLGLNYGGGNEDNGNLLQKVPCMHCLHSVPPTLLEAIANPCLCQRLLDTHRQVWFSLLWGHCYFLLGPGAHNVLFVPPRVCFPPPWKFCNQIPLTFKVKFPGGSQSLCQIPRLGNMLWALEVLQKCNNLFLL